MIPKLAGVHTLKLPVADLDRSIPWYGTRLGYQVAIEFREHGRRTGVVMTHPDGGPDLALNLNPDRAKASAGFDYFSIGVPDRDGIEALAAHLSGLGSPMLACTSPRSDGSCRCCTTLMATRSASTRWNPIP
ncbi:VOC family protein [Arthrobacter alpinus]|nr:VOC family protein [Arthrobacter alpinus]